MSDKETVLEFVKRLPAKVSLQEILREIEFIAAVKEGLEEIDQGQGISVESVEQMLEGYVLDLWMAFRRDVPAERLYNQKQQI